MFPGPILALFAVASLRLPCAANGNALPAVITNPLTFSQKEFDYLVVGGGISGLVVASRLSEVSSIQVGVIEAGDLKLNDPLIDIPINFGAAQGIPEYDWKFQSTPQTALAGRTLAMPSGKAVGGSSILSAFTWHRASSVEYDHWATAFQNGPGWNFTSLLPYFKRAENWTPPPIVFPGQVASKELKTAMGKSGPMPINYNNFYPEAVPAAISALNNLGVRTNSDPSSGDGTGVSLTARTVNKTTGLRATTASTYLLEAGTRSNLHVLSNALATKINFDTATQNRSLPTAGSVEYTSGNKTYQVRFKAELVLALGPMKTPQLLEISGIGNTTLLDKLGIQAIADLPAVGENLQDPTLTLQEFVAKPGVLTLDALRLNATFFQEEQALLASNGTGALTYTTTNLANEPLQNVMSAAHLADLVSLVKQTAASLTPTPLGKIRDSILQEWMNSTQVGWAQLLFIPGGTSTTSNDSHVAIASVNLHPFSSGNVHINTTDPSADPTINPGYFQHPFDPALHGHMMTAALGWASTPPVSNLILSAFSPPWNITAFDDLENYARQILVSSYHYSGTTAMAARTLGGVVDSSLRVHGLENVRIVGSSIIPMSLGSAPQTAVYAIAEKAADLIKATRAGA